MKLLCVVISFVFVNVSADIMAYKRVVSITNLIIQNASDRNDINGSNMFIYGLEFLIKAIVYENQFSMDMSILFAVPEKADLVNIQNSIDQHTEMAQEMIDILSIPMPNLPDPNMANVNLTDLGKDRRRLTGKALKKILLYAIVRYDLAMTYERLCCLIGLWISTKIPTFYIKSAEVDNNKCCVIKDEVGHVKKYAFIGNKYWQVDAENSGFQIMQLKTQLLGEEIC
ncbi:uncharacterized protein LOC126835934 isoform X3 [Adelges cooleyi]|uniref:uncharacterized protein LOC126835934 isoform X3 n=1 Tax=Adelges cooleyi TaxID=133065 RepID=UPI00217F2AA9|nr:uncharacterized protein LOC126835934 isoform X3 [Adelges cooleyi]